MNVAHHFVQVAEGIVRFDGPTNHHLHLSRHIYAHLILWAQLYSFFNFDFSKQQIENLR